MAIEPSLSPPNAAPVSASPPAEVLLTARDYDRAVAAVDVLADADFPVDHVAIVGHGIRTVEQVTGRWGRARAVGVGALNGALVGLFFGLLFDWWGALTPEIGWGSLALLGLVYGAVAGTVAGLLLRGFAGGGRHFASARALDADRYDVVLTGGDRVEALRVLRGAGLLVSA
jgi:hypothetical protein